MKVTAAALRDQGMVPCVFYGPKEKSVAISSNKIEFIKALREAGESTVVVLDTGKDKIEALIHDVTYDPVSGEVIHADFYIPEKGKKVEVSVPVEFTGVSAAVKDLGGTLVKVLHEIEVEALPANLPHVILVDISALVDLESQILAGVIKLPEGVSLITEAEEVIASVSVAEDEIEEAKADISEVEVVDKKGKKDEEGAAPAKK